MLKQNSLHANMSVDYKNCLHGHGRLHLSHRPLSNPLLESQNSIWKRFPISALQL